MICSGGNTNTDGDGDDDGNPDVWDTSPEVDEYRHPQRPGRGIVLFPDIDIELIGALREASPDVYPSRTLGIKALLRAAQFRVRNYMMMVPESEDCNVRLMLWTLRTEMRVVLFMLNWTETCFPREIGYVLWETAHAIIGTGYIYTGRLPLSCKRRSWSFIPLPSC